MTKSKKTKKALLASVLSIMLCVAMLAGTTFAWFTDTAGSDNNRVKSGNLRIGLVGSNDEELGEDPLFGEGNLWEPGQVYFKELKVVNEGDLAAKFSVNLNGDSLKKNYRVDPMSVPVEDDEDGKTEIKYIWMGNTLVDVIKVAAYTGTFTELVEEVNQKKTDGITRTINEETGEKETVSVVDALKELIAGLEGDDADANAVAYAEDEEGTETGTEGTFNEDDLPDPDEDEERYVEYALEYWDDYVEYIKGSFSDHKEHIDTALASIAMITDMGEDEEAKNEKKSLIKDVIGWIRADRGGEEEAEKMLQICKAAVASLLAHGETPYNDKEEGYERDVVTVAVALTYLGELEDLVVQESLAGTSPSDGNAFLEGILAPRGEEKEITVGEGEDETKEILKDHKVFTLIAFWLERGEADNGWNLKNGRQATTLMTVEDVDSGKDVEDGWYTGKLESSLQIEFDVIVYATQTPYEMDTFGTEYDEDAWEDEWKVFAPDDPEEGNG